MEDTRVARRPKAHGSLNQDSGDGVEERRWYRERIQMGAWSSRITTKDACSAGEGNGSTLRSRRKNGLGEEKVVGDRSKINEQPQGLVVWARGSWKS